MTAEVQQFTPIPEELYKDGQLIAPVVRPSSIGLPKPLLRNELSLFRPPSTPNTFITLGDAAIKPDLSLYCPDCDLHVEMSHLSEHRQYHHALTTLKFIARTPPTNIKDLAERRRQVLNELKNQDNNMDMIRKVNEAHDIIRSHIERTFEVSREFDDSNIQTFVTGTGLDCSCECVLAVGICSDENGRYKSLMEDRRVYQDHFGNDASKAFLGLYDGHHGSFAAEVAANEVHHVLLQELIRFDPKTTCTCTVNMVTDESSSDYDENRPYTSSSERVVLHYESTNMVQSIIHTCEKNLETLDEKKFKARDVKSSPFSSLMSTAFVSSYNEVDRYLTYGMDEHSRVRWSGCSALTVLIKDNDEEDPQKREDGGEDENEDDENSLMNLGAIHLAQAGEVRAILVRSGKPHRLTKDHSLRNNREKNRVIKSGGSVTGTDKDLRINGVLSSTRGLGNHGDPALKKCIRVDPHTSAVQIDQYAEFLILASRGVWDVFTDHEAATLVGQLLPKNLQPILSRPNTTLHSILGLTPAVNRDPDLDRSTPGPDDLDWENDDLEKTDIVPERPNTGKSSRVSFNLENIDIDEVSDIDNTELRSMSSMMADELARGQLRRDFAKEMSERLVHAAIMAGAKDNITAMVVLFPGSGI